MQKLLKIWISKFKNFERISIIAVLCGIIIVAVAGLVVVKIIKKQAEQVYFNDIKNVDFRSYSLNGKVTKLTLPTIEFEVGQVVTEKNENVLKYKTYTVLVNDATQFFVRSQDQTFVAGSSNDLAEGAVITVYSTQNPYETSGFTATKVEVN